MVVDHEAFFAPRDYKSPQTINLGTFLSGENGDWWRLRGYHFLYRIYIPHLWLLVCVPWRVLILMIWSPSSSVDPKYFKLIMSNFAHRFLCKDDWQSTMATVCVSVWGRPQISKSKGLSVCFMVGPELLWHCLFSGITWMIAKKQGVKPIEHPVLNSLNAKLLYFTNIDFSPIRCSLFRRGIRVTSL